LQIPHNIISFKYVVIVEFTLMITSRSLAAIIICLLIVLSGTSCRVWNNVFGPKYGCPANGRSFGAEKILSGEKPPKARKFKA
jgi:hypothetical protein